MFYLILITLAAFLIVSPSVPINVFTAWNLTPLIVSFALYYYAKKKGKSVFGAYGFLLGSMLVSGYIHLAWMFDWSGTATGSSTSGLIFIFIPIYSVIAGLIGFAVGAGFNHRIIRPIMVVVLIVSIVYIPYQIISDIKLTSSIKKIIQMDDAELSFFLDNDPYRNNRNSLGAVASNKAASAATLARIAALDDDSLHESYGCKSTFTIMLERVDLCGGNTDGRAVMVQVAYHPNLSADTLPRLAKSSNPYVLAGIAGNSNATNAVLEDIYQRRNQFGSRWQRIETELAANEATPEFILRELTYESQVYGRTLKAIVRNSSLPSDLKKHAMGRIDRCEYEIIDYPFTKCIPKATNWESQEEGSAKNTNYNESSCSNCCYEYYKRKQYKKVF